MSRTGKAYLLTWGLNNPGSSTSSGSSADTSKRSSGSSGFFGSSTHGSHSALLILNGDASEAIYLSFYPGNALRPMERSSAREGKDGGFRDYESDTQTGTYTCDEIRGLDYHEMRTHVEGEAYIDHSYSLMGYNCADAAEAVLRAGGLTSLPKDTLVSTPASLRTRVIRHLSLPAPSRGGATVTPSSAAVSVTVKAQYGFERSDRDSFTALAGRGSFIMPPASSGLKSRPACPTVEVLASPADAVAEAARTGGGPPAGAGVGVLHGAVSTLVPAVEGLEPAAPATAALHTTVSGGALNTNVTSADLPEHSPAAPAFSPDELLAGPPPVSGPENPSSDNNGLHG